MHIYGHQIFSNNHNNDMKPNSWEGKCACITETAALLHADFLLLSEVVRLVLSRLVSAYFLLQITIHSTSSILFMRSADQASEMEWSFSSLLPTGTICVARGGDGYHGKLRGAPFQIQLARLAAPSSSVLRVCPRGGTVATFALAQLCNADPFHPIHCVISSCCTRFLKLAQGKHARYVVFKTREWHWHNTQCRQRQQLSKHRHLAVVLSFLLACSWEISVKLGIKGDRGGWVAGRCFAQVARAYGFLLRAFRVYLW